MPERVNVLSRAPRDRSKFEGLCGVIYATILSESYIHVGSSPILFLVDEDKLTRLIKSGKRDIGSLLQAVKFAEEMQFNISGKRLVIPGASVKGNIRSRLELSFRPKEGYVRSCFIRARPPLTAEPPKGTHGWRHFKIWSKALFEERGPPCNLTRRNEVCLICDLFGTAGLKSLIDFSDFVGESTAEDMHERLSLEYGINLVAAKPGSKFNGRILFYNLSPSELGLIMIGMGIGRSVLLGRLKYRHRVYDRNLKNEYKFGKVRYEINAIRFLEESRSLELGEIIIRGGERFEGRDLTKLIMGLKSRAYEEFKDEIAEVDEVAVIEQLL